MRVKILPKQQKVAASSVWNAVQMVDNARPAYTEKVDAISTEDKSKTASIFVAQKRTKVTGVGICKSSRLSRPTQLAAAIQGPIVKSISPQRESQDEAVVSQNSGENIMPAQYFQTIKHSIEQSASQIMTGEQNLISKTSLTNRIQRKQRPATCKGSRSKRSGRPSRPTTAVIRGQGHERAQSYVMKTNSNVFTKTKRWETLDRVTSHDAASTF